AKEASRWSIAPRSLDWQPKLRNDLPRQAQSENALDRVRALADLERHREHFDAEIIASVIRANWAHKDRPVRQATARLIAELPAIQDALGQRACKPLEQTSFALGRVGQNRGEALAWSIGVLALKQESSEARLAAVRVIQLALGDVVARSAQGM